jgi:RNA-dependent RNA polymerase
MEPALAAQDRRASLSCVRSLAVYIALQYPKAAPVPVHRRIIDVLRCSRMTDGSKISSEVIINLAENRVPWEVFKSLITTNFQALLDDWLCFDRPDFAVHLRSFVMRNSNVLGARQARLLAGEARARGLKWHYKTVEVAEDEEAAEDDDDHAHSSAWWPDPISRLPSSLEETVIEFLDAGFTPANCPVLRKKLLECIKSSLHRCINPPRYSIPVPMSCFGFFMPGQLLGGRHEQCLIRIVDPCGVLEDGQVYIRRSKNLEFIDRSQRWESDLILGDVLVRQPFLSTSCRNRYRLDYALSLQGLNRCSQGKTQSEQRTNSIG